MGPRSITVKNLQQQLVQAGVLSCFIIPEIGQNFLIYGLNEDAGDGNLRVYIATLQRKADGGTLGPVSDPDWEYVARVLRKMNRNDADGAAGGADDIAYQLIEADGNLTGEDLQPALLTQHAALLMNKTLVAKLVAQNQDLQASAANAAVASGAAPSPAKVMMDVKPVNEKPKAPPTVKIEPPSVAAAVVEEKKNEARNELNPPAIHVGPSHAGAKVEQKAEQKTPPSPASAAVRPPPAPPAPAVMAVAQPVVEAPRESALPIITSVVKPQVRPTITPVQTNSNPVSGPFKSPRIEERKEAMTPPSIPSDASLRLSSGAIAEKPAASAISTLSPADNSLSLSSGLVPKNETDSVLHDVQSTLNSLAGMAHNLSQQKMEAVRLQEMLEERRVQAEERERQISTEEERLHQMENRLLQEKQALERTAESNATMLAERSAALQALAESVDSRDRATTKRTEVLQQEQQKFEKLVAQLRIRTTELDERESALQRQSDELAEKLKQLLTAKEKFSAIVKGFNETVQFNNAISAITKSVSDSN